MENGVIQTLMPGGSGGEADVWVEMRTRFPGIGGTRVTNEGVITAKRVHYNKSPGVGHDTFLKHALLKKLDDYFYRKGVYNFAHITRPLGSYSEQEDNKNELYLYEWAPGNEGFAWELSDGQGNRTPIKLTDFNSFCSNFLEAGINMRHDIVDSDSGASKNIIHMFPYQIEDYTLNLAWKRIDFGYSSIQINYDHLFEYLEKNADDLINVLRYGRHEMMIMSVQYLAKKELTEKDKGKLEMLVRDYRGCATAHLVSGGRNGYKTVLEDGNQRLH